MNKTLNKYCPLCIYVVLGLATFVAFEQVRHNDFVRYDDFAYVVENPHVNGGITRESVCWAFATSLVGHWHPLTLLSHMLDCELFGLDPSWHHLTSLFFHIANTLLLLWVLERMTGSVWCSAFVAAVFALHPLRVESVAWVAERKDVLSGFFWMLTIAAYVRYAERPGIGRYLLVVLALSLGLMAKPVLVTLPFVLLLLDYWPLGRLQWAHETGAPTLLQSERTKVTYQLASVRRLITEKIPLFVLVGISSVITFIVAQSSGAVKQVTLIFRIINVFVSYLTYIEKMIWPSRLALLYPYPVSTLLLGQFVVAAILLLLISMRVIRSARTHKYLPVGWLWYLGSLVPMIGLVQAGWKSMADRCTYLSSIGISIIVAWGAVELLAKWRYRRIILGTLAMVALLALSICTRMQVRHWKNSLTLFGHSVEATKNNYIMRVKYGRELVEIGRLDEAITQFSEALRINPRFLEARINIGVAFSKQERLDEAVACFEEVLQVNKNSPDAYQNLASAYARLGKYDLAIQNYKEVLRLKHNYISARSNLAMLLLRRGKIDEAIEHCREVLRNSPNDERAQWVLKAALAKQHKSDYRKEGNEDVQKEVVLP